MSEIRENIDLTTVVPLSANITLRWVSQSIAHSFNLYFNLYFDSFFCPVFLQLMKQVK